ncbi:MAG: hypothetical protein C0404_02210 [Verrucomicrobia bacterium]|nr:hypothetical protein [Verrucomicrobiota bacterium]
MIEKYLDDLESRIDPDVEEALISGWKDFSDGKFKGGFFVAQRTKKIPSRIKWPQVTVNEALDDVTMMAIQQLATCSRALADGSGALMCVRSNYGTGILPSVFGADIFLMDAELNTLPTSLPLHGDRAKIEGLIERGIPDLRGGYGKRTFDAGEYFQAMFASYPKISRYVKIYHPDLQGPMDVCELLWGSSIFLDIVDHPELVKSFLSLVTETYAAFMVEWNKIAPLAADYSVHWSLMHKGTVMLRDDSAMNFSPDMFDEFIRPYDQRLLNMFGGGAIHFCGKGDHYIHLVGQMTGVHAVAMSQPEYNNMDVIFDNTVDRGIRLIGLSRKAGEAAVARGRDLRGNVHCW